LLLHNLQHVHLYHHRQYPIGDIHKCLLHLLGICDYRSGDGGFAGLARTVLGLIHFALSTGACQWRDGK
jgi:hypothetical protein